ncbi:hypothetical protein BH10PSE2_BH10PSE2_07790 [soil metagenome]
MTGPPTLPFDDPTPGFRDDGYLRMNTARLEHLSSVLQRMGSYAPTGSLLELGAGIGDHTAFWIDRGFRVVSSDARPECVEAIKNRFPDLNVRLIDADAPQSFEERFDVVYAYGLLYHLQRPALAIASMSQACSGTLFLETCVSFGDELAVNLVPEPADLPSQSFHGMGCRPTRPWVFAELQKHFLHVYQLGWQPNHEQFPTDWSAPESAKAALHRAIFVASRTPLNVPGLVPRVLNRQTEGVRPPVTSEPGDITSLVRQHRIDTVLDVGANVGQFAQSLRVGGYQGRLISFEPSSDAFAALSRISESDPLWTCRALALGSSNSQATFNLSANSYSSSFLQPTASTLAAEPAVGFIGEEIVAVHRLDTLWPTFGEGRFLLKIDVQGLELEVLIGAGDRLAAVDLLFLEVSLVPVYVGEPVIETIFSYLRREGFVPVWIGPGFCDPASGQMFQCDVAFARR